jgi:flagellar hook-length control protein FliK
MFESLLDGQDGAAPAPGDGKSGLEQVPSPAANATQTVADAASADPSRRPAGSGSAAVQGGPGATAAPASDGDQITPVLAPPVLAAPNVPIDLSPAKTGKTDGRSASEAEAGDKSNKKDAAVADGTQVAQALIAAAAPQKSAQGAGPTDRAKTTDTVNAANPVQAAQTASATAAAGAAKTAPAAQTESADAGEAADAAVAVDAAELTTPQGQAATDTADQDPSAQTPPQTKPSEAGTPVANAVARSRAAPESAVVLPRVTRPFGKAAQEKAPAGSTEVTPPAAGNAGEASGIAAPDPNAPPTAAANAHPATAAKQTSAGEPATQARHAETDPSSSAPADKTANTGDPGLTGPAGAGTAMAATSTSHSATPSASSATSASPTPTAPVPLAGIPLAIAGRALAGERHFDIRLDPPELGRIEVRMKVDRDGRITSHLIADRHDTLDLLRRDGAGLERALQDAGLKTAGDGLQFSLRDQSGNTGQDGRQNSNNLTHLVVQDEVAPVRESLPMSYGRLAGRIGGLDIRV